MLVEWDNPDVVIAALEKAVIWGVYIVVVGRILRTIKKMVVWMVKKVRRKSAIL